MTLQQPKRIIGARALLFDRLFDDEPDSRIEAVPLRALTAGELIHSVVRELSRLMSTRCATSIEMLKQSYRTTIDYGLPDCSHLSPFSEPDRRSLAAAIAQAITAFEPRLQNVHVEVVPTVVNNCGLTVGVHARLVTETVNEAVYFPLAIDEKGGLPIAKEIAAAAAAG